VPYAYYARLAPRQRATYRRSNETEAIVLPAPAPLLPLVDSLEAALATTQRARVEPAAQALASALLDSLAVRRAKVTEGFFKRESSLFKQIVAAR
jgi:hypothetical protein